MMKLFLSGPLTPYYILLTFEDHVYQEQMLLSLTAD